MKNYITILVFLISNCLLAQSNLDKLLKTGEIIITGLSFIKGNKTAVNAKVIESVCIKNKLKDKITFRITGKDEDGNEIKKELVIQNDGKECLLELPKGIYSYEIELATKEIYKKGEYKFDDEIVITVKDD